jgi:hypothetical protein
MLVRAKKIRKPTNPINRLLALQIWLDSLHATNHAPIVCHSPRSIKSRATWCTVSASDETISIRWWASNLAVHAGRSATLADAIVIVTSIKFIRCYDATLNQVCMI